MEIVITNGEEFGDTLTLTIVGRVCPDATDYWDGNWLTVELRIDVGAFQGRLTDSLRRDELANFAQQFARLQEDLRGEAHFQTMEHWLVLRVVGDGRGHLDFHCTIRDQRSWPVNRLECVISTDQTFTRSTVAQLAAIIQAYPVIGQP